MAPIVINCIEKLEYILKGNSQMVIYYESLMDTIKLNEVMPSLSFLCKQKQRFNNGASYESKRLKKLHANIDFPEVIVTLPLDTNIDDESIDSYLLHLIGVEQRFIQFYLEIASKLNPEGAVYHRLLNHIEEMKDSLGLLERNVTHQQELLTA